MIYGVTGGIGSGKSTVSAILREKGYTVFDADEIGREVTAAGKPLLKILVKEFGPQILKEDGNLDRKLLASIALTDRAKTHRLNELVQTAILCKAIEDGYRMAVSGHNQVIFFDVPLLFEAGWDKYVRQVWLVTAPEDVRIQRVEDRDGLTEDEIRTRIKLQMSEEEKMERSDVVIINDEGMDKLRALVEKAIAERL